MRIDYYKDATFTIENERDLQCELQELLDRNKVLHVIFIFFQQNEKTSWSYYIACALCCIQLEMAPMIMYYRFFWLLG